MKLKISENIRAFRKENKLTQEQLAEAMGVTIGAVSKWELGQSMPDIDKLAELADIFDISIDTLLGYESSGGTAEGMTDEIVKEVTEKNLAKACEIADKAIKKFPNNFKVIYSAGVAYLLKRIEDDDKEYYKTALKYLKRCKNFNRDEEKTGVSQNSLNIYISSAYVGLN